MRQAPGLGAYAHLVADSWARARARERIEAAASEPVDARRLRLQVLAVLREVIDFDAYVWLLTDPVTTVGAAPVADVPCLPELPALIKAKYATPVNRWTVLQQQDSPAATLSDAADGSLNRSLMWRDVLCRYGIGDVASAVFADQFGCWGFLDLWRNDTGGSFSAADAGFLAAAAAPLATALRHGQARTFVDPATQHRPDLGPVVLTLDDDLRITSRTAASHGWLDALLPPSLTNGPSRRASTTSPPNSWPLSKASTRIRRSPARIWLMASGSPCVPPGSRRTSLPPAERQRSLSLSRRRPPPSGSSSSAALSG